VLLLRSYHIKHGSMWRSCLMFFLFILKHMRVFIRGLGEFIFEWSIMEGMETGC